VTAPAFPTSLPGTLKWLQPAGVTGTAVGEAPIFPALFTVLIGGMEQTTDAKQPLKSGLGVNGPGPSAEAEAKTLAGSKRFSADSEKVPRAIQIDFFQSGSLEGINSPGPSLEAETLASSGQFSADPEKVPKAFPIDHFQNGALERISSPGSSAEAETLASSGQFSSDSEKMPKAIQIGHFHSGSLERPDTKPSKETAGTANSPADPLGPVPAQEVGTTQPSPLRVLLKLPAAANSETVLAAEGRPGWSTHSDAASQDVNHPAPHVPKLEVGLQQSAPEAVTSPAEGEPAMQNAADEIPRPTDAPAGDAQPNWTRLPDSAMVAAPPVASPSAQAPQQPGGFHTAPARRQKVTASSQAHVPELPAMDPNSPARNPAPFVPVQAAPVAVPEQRVAEQTQVWSQPVFPVPAPAPQIASDSQAPRRQPVATEAPALPPMPDAPVRAATTTTTGWTDPAETPNLAFTAHLIPTTAPVPPMVADGAAGHPQTEDLAKPAPPDPLPLVVADPFGKSAVPVTANLAGTATGQRQDKAPWSGQQGKEDAPRFRKPDAPPSPTEEAPPAGGKVAAQLTVAPEPQADRDSGQTAGSPGLKLLRDKETPEPASAPELPRAPAAAHDIRLQVNGGERRVEVRLVERDGEVHVAVRTPDAHLADTLREDLPTLSSRLTDSGFRTETWHPGASAGAEWHRQAEPAGGGLPQGSSGQPRENGRQQQPGDQQPPRAKVPEEQLHRKEKGKDFEWFMSTLR
jgi:hypothetical protein